MAAYHELAHCVVAEASSLRTKRMRVRRAFFGGAEGCTELDLPNTPGVRPNPDDHRSLLVDDEQEFFHAYCLCCVAGWRGVAHWYRSFQGSEEPVGGVAPSYGNSDDMRAFRRVSRYIGLSERVANAAADRIITMHWGKIDAFAPVLYQRKKLESSKVVRR